MALSSSLSGWEEISDLNTEIREKTVEMFSVLISNRWSEKEETQGVPVNGEEFTNLIATEYSTCDTAKQQAEVKPHYFQLTLVCFLAPTCQKKGIPEILLLLLQHGV